MRNLLAVVLGLGLAGCCGASPKTFGASGDNCGKPVYRAPDCAGRVEAPGAPQVQGAPLLSGIKWPWECDEARRGQPVYKKPDCEAFNAKVGGFFEGVNNSVFGCNKPEPAPVAGAAPESPCK